MSAEPNRRTPYSTDLRWRIVWQRLAKGLTFQNIAQNLSISTATASNIFKLFQATGEVDPKRPPRRDDLRKLDEYHELYIIGLIFECPNLQLQEIAYKVEEITGTVVSTSTLCRLLGRHGFSHKKIQSVALQRSLDLRALYVASIFTFNRDMFVWIDETGSDLKEILRRYGYALRGERAVCHRLQVRGQRISPIAAISSDGLLGVELSTGSVNGEKFYDFVRGTLIPEMLPFDGTSPRSIAIMDNCSIHHMQDVSDLFTDAGILQIFLPPYSPDMNPIEMAFGYVKGYLKKHEDIMHLIPPTSLIKSAFDSITTEMCNGWIKHSKY